MPLFNPDIKTDEIKKIVVTNGKRRYYRVARPGRWYGGIATADCCGCNLRCIFCWSNKPRDNPERIGEFYTPKEIAERLIECAEQHHYHLLRISGNEPTIGKEHLLNLLSIIDKTKYLFILETNGILLDREYIKDLSNFRRLHIRVSLKGTTSEEFSNLTGATPETFDRILNNLSLIANQHLRFNLAVMLSFSPDKNIVQLKEQLKKISPRIIEGFEEEYVFLYPHVIKRLKRAKIEPLVAYSPEGIPKELI